MKICCQCLFFQRCVIALPYCLHALGRLTFCGLLYSPLCCTMPFYCHLVMPYCFLVILCCVVPFSCLLVMLYCFLVILCCVVPFSCHLVMLYCFLVILSCYTVFLSSCAVLCCLLLVVCRICTMNCGLL